MDLTEDYVISVLGHDPQRPSHDKVKVKFQKVYGVLGWDSADVLRLLNDYTWEEELALDAAVDQKYQKGGDWVPTGGKKKEKKPSPSPQSNQKSARGRGAAQQQKGDVQNSQRGGGRSRGGNQPDSGNRGGRGRGRGSSSAGRGKPSETKAPQQNQGPAAGRVETEGPKHQVPASAPHPSQPAPAAPAAEPVQQPPAPTDSDSSASSQGLQGEWALRAQRKRLESTQPPPQKNAGHAQQFGHPHQRPQHPHSHPHHPHPHSHPHSHPHQQLHPHQQHGQHGQQLHSQTHSQRSTHDHQAHEQHEAVSNGGRDLDHLDNILEETHISAGHHHNQHELEESNPSVSHSVVDNPQVDHSHEVQLEVQSHSSSSGIADPVCLAPGLPGVDTTNYQFRFVFETDEAEKDAVETNQSENTDAVEISSESQNEKSQDHQTESRNEQHSSQSFDQPQKAPNVPYPQQFENMEEPPMSQQIFFGYQQIPPVYLQQPPRNDPSLKVHNDMNPAVLPHLLAPPNPFYSGLYPGSHHLLGDQQFPFNPLPSDPAMNDMRVARMYGMDLGYPFHPQQHQNPHGQHPDAQPNLRNSPPINGSPNQFSSGNASANASANAESSKFPQSQQHEINGIHGSGPLHDIQSHQPNPQLSHQHHQPFPYYYQPFIHGQFPLHVPMRTPYYGAHKGHPGHPPSSFPQVIDMHGAHGPHQPSYFPQEMKGQKSQHIPVMYGHPSEGQEGAFDKSQSQSSSQQPQQQQSHLSGDLHKGQGFGYNFSHSYQGQPQN